MTPESPHDRQRETFDEEPWPRDDALDRLLALDEVDVPPGLGQRLRDRAQADREEREHEPFPLRSIKPARKVAVLALALAASIALLLLAPWEGGNERDRSAKGGAGQSVDLTGDVARTDGGTSDAVAPSDELLAALDALEAYDFLVEELEPFEADALFLLEPADPLLLDLLEEDS